MTQFGVPQGGDLVDGGDRYATWDAAYVLGALSSSDRREYEAHLEGCERCRAAVAEVRSTGERKMLEPMTAFERKVVHDEVLAEGLTSESEGVEPERRVVVLPH